MLSATEIVRTRCVCHGADAPGASRQRGRVARHRLSLPRTRLHSFEDVRRVTDDADDAIDDPELIGGKSLAFHELMCEIVDVSKMGGDQYSGL